LITNCKICNKEYDYVPGTGCSKNLCHSCRVVARTKRLKKEAVEYKGGKCSICGYNKCLSALDFHHVNPEEKEINFSNAWNKTSKEKIKQEIDKCILVCSNCHREIHDKDFIPLEEYEKYIFHPSDKKKQRKQELENIAKENKIPIDKMIQSSFTRRKVNRPSYEEFIKEMDELDWNYSAMGRKYNVSDNTIRKWEKTYKKYGF